MLTVRELRKSFGDREILKGISFTAREGEIISLLGANGSGKTTTFRIIMNLMEPDSGKVLYNNRPLKRELSGYLPEERSMYYDVRVDDQLRHFGCLKGMNDAQLDKELERWYRTTGTYDYKEALPIQLSKGNLQKIQLIMALLHDPRLIILDEPWTALDEANVELFKKVLLQQKRKNKIIILSSHQHQTVQQIADRFMYLYKGNLAINVTRQQLENDPYRVLLVEHREGICLPENSVVSQRKEGRYMKYVVSGEKQAYELVRMLMSINEVISFTERPLVINDLIEVLR